MNNRNFWKMTNTKVLIPRIQRDSCFSDSSSSDVIIRSTPGRKRKLDHLTQEEKIQRKKLKNRVAAQTSRDRKKKQMEEMSVTVERQEKELSQLRAKCEQLKTKCEKLEKENRKLKAQNLSSKQLHVVTHSIPEEHKYTRSFVEDTTKVDENCVGTVVIKTEGPAASSEPLQKVLKMNTVTTEKLSKKYVQQHIMNVKALLKVIMLCLLYKNSSKTSTSSTTSRSLPKALSQNFSPVSRQILQRAIAQLPKMKAMNSSCLDQWWRIDRLGPQNKEWNPPKIAIKSQ